LRFRELPGFHPLFIDLAEGVSSAVTLFPRPPDAGTLLAEAARVPEGRFARRTLCDVMEEQAARFESGTLARSNITRLRTPGTAVIVATLRPRILGGPLRDWLKAMTAVRLAAWLSEHGTPAIPVAWIDPTLDPADLCVGLLAPERPLRMELDAALCSSYRLPDSIRPWLHAVAAASGPDLSEDWRRLEQAYAPGKSLVDAWGITVSKMLEKSGIVVFDPDHPGFRESELGIDGSRYCGLVKQQGDRLLAAGYMNKEEVSELSVRDVPPSGHRVQMTAPFVAQCLLLPIAAVVVEEAEILDAAVQLTACSELHGHAPMVWQRLSATVVDARGKKLLDRYNLSIRDLCGGPQRLTEALDDPSPEHETVVPRLEALNAAVKVGLAELADLVPAEDRLRRAIDDSRRRMTYQIGKLTAAYSAARERRRQIISNQAQYLCSHLAPWGDLQERGVAGFQFAEWFSRSAPQSFNQDLADGKFEHQVVFL
jgi:uncharacterized protein YllA (UPF0747 family)